MKFLLLYPLVVVIAIVTVVAMVISRALELSCIALVELGETWCDENISQINNPVRAWENFKENIKWTL